MSTPSTTMKSTILSLSMKGLRFFWDDLRATIRGAWNWTGAGIIRIVSGLALLYCLVDVNHGLDRLSENPVLAVSAFLLLLFLLRILAFEEKFIRLILAVILVGVVVMRLPWQDPKLGILPLIGTTNPEPPVLSVLWLILAGVGSLGAVSTALALLGMTEPKLLKGFCILFASGTLGLGLSIVPMPDGSINWANFVNIYTLGTVLFAIAMSTREFVSKYFQPDLADMASNLLMISFLAILFVLVLNTGESAPNYYDILRQTADALFSRAALISVVVATTIQVPMEFVNKLYPMLDWPVVRQHILAVVMGAKFPTVQIRNGVMKECKNTPNQTVDHTIQIRNGDIEECKNTAHLVVYHMGGPAALEFSGESQDPDNHITKDDAKNGGAILESAGRISRVVGPADAVLKPEERIRYTFDLRPQKRKRLVQAVTRDGIPVRSGVEVVFRMQLRTPKTDISEPPRAKPNGWLQKLLAWLTGLLQFLRLDRVFALTLPESLPEPYRCAQAPGYKAAKSAAVARSSTGCTVYAWTNRLSLAAEKLLQDILSERFLYELVEEIPSGNNKTHPLPKLEAELESALRPVAKDLGALLLRVTVNRIELDSGLGPQVRAEILQDLNRIRNQWVAGWAAQWEERERVVEGDQSAGQVDLDRHAEALGEDELLQTLADALGTRTFRTDGDTRLNARYHAAAILDNLTAYLVEYPSPAAQEAMRIWRTLI